MISFYVLNAVDYSTALLEHRSEEDLEVVNMTARNSFSKLIARLMEKIFKEEELATHSLTGLRTSKPPLPANKVSVLSRKFLNSSFRSIISFT
jgi:hypothetical protein